MARFFVYYTEEVVRQAFLEADSLEEAQQKVFNVQDGEEVFDDVFTEERWHDGSLEFDIDTLEEVI